MVLGVSLATCRGVSSGVEVEALGCRNTPWDRLFNSKEWTLHSRERLVHSLESAIPACAGMVAAVECGIRSLAGAACAWT